MSDIAKRLRDLLTAALSEHRRELFGEAADEIERLEAEVKKCDGLIQWLWKQNEKDYADNARLRAELQRVLDYMERSFGEFTVANAIRNKELTRGK